MKRWTKGLAALMTAIMIICGSAGFAEFETIPADSSVFFTQTPEPTSWSNVYVDISAAAPEDSDADFDDMMVQSIRIIEKRLSDLGLPQASVWRTAYDGIRVEILNLPDTVPLETVLKMLCSESKLEFIDPTGNVFITGDMVESVDEFSVFHLNEEGTKALADVTSMWIGMNLVVTLDGEVLIDNVIQDRITGGSFVLTGNQTSIQIFEAQVRYGRTPLKLTEAGSGLLDPENMGEPAIYNASWKPADPDQMFYGTWKLIRLPAFPEYDEPLNSGAIVSCLCIGEKTITSVNIQDGERWIHEETYVVRANEDGTMTLITGDDPETAISADIAIDGDTMTMTAAGIEMVCQRQP